MIVDGFIAFSGGINIAGECFKETSKYGVWKDSSIEIRGEAVKSFTKMFLMIWNSNLEENKKFNKFKDLSYKKYLPKKKYLNAGYVIPYGQNPFNKEGVTSKVYLNIIQQSTKYLYIFKGFSITYGSLTTLMLIMMWTYSCFYTVFLGAELNKLINNKKSS